MKSIISAFLFGFALLSAGELLAHGPTATSREFHPAAGSLYLKDVSIVGSDYIAIGENGVSPQNGPTDFDYLPVLFGQNLNAAFGPRILLEAWQFPKRVMSWDNGFIIAGNSFVDDHAQNPDLFFWSLDDSIVWRANLDRPENVSSRAILDAALTPQGILNVVGFDATVQNIQFWLAQVAPASGEIIWRRNIAFEGVSNIQNLLLVQSGADKFVVGQGSSADGDIFVSKFDEDGEQLWMTVHHIDIGVLRSAALNSYNGVIAVGSESEVAVNSLAIASFVLLTDDEGQAIQLAVTSISAMIGLSAVTPVPGGGYIACGHVNAEDGDSDALIQRLDENGQNMWNFALGEPDVDEELLSIVWNPALAGYSAVGSSGAFGLLVNGENDPDYNYFTHPTNGDFTHNFLVDELQTPEGDPYPIGSDVGVFYGGICVGAAVWWGHPFSIVAFNDDDSTEVQDGFEADSSFTFQIGDNAVATATPGLATIDEGDETFQINGFTHLTITSARQVRIDLDYGWNLISANADPLDPVIPKMWAPVTQNGLLVLLKDKSGHFYAPNHQFSNIGSWISEQGYQAKMSGATVFEFPGRAIERDRPIELTAGWETIAYFPVYSLPAPIAVASIRADMVILKDGSGRFYHPGYNFNNMGPMRPGKGYWVKLTEASTLIYPPVRGGDAVEDVVFAPSIHFGKPVLTAQNMSLLIRSPQLAVSGSELAAYSSSGSLIGSVVLEGAGPWGMALWADDPTTDEMDGAVDGEPIQFRYWNGVSEQAITVNWEDGEGSYQTDGFGLINVVPAAIAPTQFTINEAFPNPFNSRVSVSFALPSSGTVKMQVLDLSGRIVADLVNGNLSAGYHSIGWNAEGFPSGLYLISVEANGQTLATKATLLR